MDEYELNDPHSLEVEGAPSSQQPQDVVFEDLQPRAPLSTPTCPSPSPSPGGTSQHREPVNDRHRDMDGHNQASHYPSPQERLPCTNVSSSSASLESGYSRQTQLESQQDGSQQAPPGSNATSTCSFAYSSSKLSVDAIISEHEVRFQPDPAPRLAHDRAFDESSISPDCSSWPSSNIQLTDDQILEVLRSADWYQTLRVASLDPEGSMML